MLFTKLQTPQLRNSLYGLSLLASLTTTMVCGQTAPAAKEPVAGFEIPVD